jgi:hypothetical protein
MTFFDRFQAENLPTLDSALVWAVCALRAANKSQFNSEMSDITKPSGFDESVQWMIQKSEYDELFFVYDATLYCIDHHPLKNKANTILDTVVPYSSYENQVWDFDVDIPLDIAGQPLGDIPEWIETLEQFLGFCLFKMSAWTEFIKAWNQRANTKPDIETWEEPYINGMRQIILNGGIPRFYIPPYWKAKAENPNIQQSPTQGNNGIISALDDENYIFPKYDLLYGSPIYLNNPFDSDNQPDNQISDVPEQQVPVIKECEEATKDAYGGDILKQIVLGQK